MLITRCPSCQTSFKVVPDQLRLGQGWVKCGKCSLAFNAERHFVQAGAEPASPGQSAAPQAAAEAASSEGLLPQHTTAAPPEPPASPKLSQPPVQAAGAAIDLPLFSAESLEQARKAAAQSGASEAIDELVALGVVRPARADAAASAAAPEKSFKESQPFASTLPFAALLARERLALRGAKESDSLPPLITGSTAEPAKDQPAPTGTLDAWRKSKQSRKERRRAASRASLQRAEPVEQAAAPADMREQLKTEHRAETVAAAPSAEATPHTPGVIEAELEDKLSFVAESRNREHWQSWPVRLTLLMLLCAGAAAAAAQAAYLNRHAIAALQPGAVPLLNQLCSQVKDYSSLPCEVEPLQRIESLRVESHSLATEPAASAAQGAASGTGNDVYLLNITLKNQLALANAWPAIDIAFTDTSGATQARRILQPKEYLPGLAPGTIAQGIKALDEQRISLRFEAPGLRLGGYEITVFYP